MKNGTVKKDNLKFVPNDIYPTIKKYIINKEDVFITVAGTIGRVGKIPFELDGANLTENADRLVFSKINQDWLICVLSSPFIQSQIAASTTKVGQPKLAITRIEQILIPLPSIYEQKRIVNKIKELEPLIDKYRDAEEKLYELNSNIKEQLKKSILQYAIEGKLIPQDPNDEPASLLLDRIYKEKQKLITEGKIKKDKNESIIYRRDNSYYEKLNNNEKCIDDQITFEIPDNWCWARLGSIGDWKAGTTPSKSNTEYYKNGSIPWLLTGDLNDGLIQEIPNKITEKAMNETSMKLNPSGSILIAMYGATIGKLGILPLPAATNQACCACNVIQPFYNLYLFYFLMANKTNFLKQGEGGAQPNISREKIIKTLIPIPPANEQHNIVSKIERINSILANL